MYVESAASPRDTAISATSIGLAEGLALLRASTLKIIRLQLALERHDRHVALEALDDLVALDHKLQNYLEAAPATGDQLMFRRGLDSDRAALNEEKLTLAAEVLRRPNNSSKQAESDAQMDAFEPGEGWLEPCELTFEPERQRRSRWWLTVLPILILVLAAGAYFLSVSDADTRFVEAMGALR